MSLAPETQLKPFGLLLRSIFSLVVLFILAGTGFGEADLFIFKTGNPSDVFPGDELLYELTIGNRGPSDATQVVVTDVLDLAAATVLASTVSQGTGCTTVGNVVTCYLGTLPFNLSATLEILVRVDPSVNRDIINQATVSSQTFDPILSNNTASATTFVLPAADMRIEKSASVTSVTPGGTIVYDVTVTNLGPAPALNVLVFETLPTGIVLAASSVSQGSACFSYPTGEIQYCLGALGAGESATISIEVVVNYTTLGLITNFAEVRAEIPDLDNTNNVAFAPVWVDSVPGDIGCVQSATISLDCSGFIFPDCSVFPTLNLFAGDPGTADCVQPATYPLSAGLASCPLQCSRFLACTSGECEATARFIAADIANCVNFDLFPLMRASVLPSGTEVNIESTVPFYSVVCDNDPLFNPCDIFSTTTESFQTGLLLDQCGPLPLCGGMMISQVSKECPLIPPPPPFDCVQAASFTFSCTQPAVSPGSEETPLLKIYAGVSPATGCSLFRCDQYPLIASCPIDCSKAFGSATPTCETFVDRLALQLTQSINLSAPGIISATNLPGGRVCVSSAVPFFTCICGFSFDVPCIGGSGTGNEFFEQGLPLDICGSVQLCTGSVTLTQEARPCPLQPRKISLTPAPNSIAATVTTNVTVTYDLAMDPTTVTPNTFAVHGLQTGFAAGSYLLPVTNTLVFSPVRGFLPGELVEVTLADGLRSADCAVPATPPCVWQFLSPVLGGYGLFCEPGQVFAPSTSNVVALGDVDQDGDLDALVGDGNASSIIVWKNDSTGFFVQVASIPTTGVPLDIQVGDLNGDGWPDAFVATDGPNVVLLNDGTGNLVASSLVLGNAISQGVALGDLDHDTDLDAFVANLSANRVWLNDGLGGFSSSTQSIGSASSTDVALADLNLDGALDAFVTNLDGSRVWFNDGSGFFVDSGQILGASRDQSVALGDLDFDGDADAFVGIDAETDGFIYPGKRVWFNDGTGVFTSSVQTFTVSNSQDVALGDLNGDGTLDAFVGNLNAPSEVFLNDGGGNFMPNGQILSGATQTSSVAIGDLDGDGDLDAFLTNLKNEPDRVWFNCPVADLAVTKTATQNPVSPGDSFTYVVQITNQGPSDANGVIVVDSLPPEVTVDNATASQGSGCTLNGQEVRCSLGMLPVSMTATVFIDVTVSPLAFQDLINFATATADEVDPATVDNSDSFVVIIEPSTPTSTATATHTPTPTSTSTFTPTTTFTFTPVPTDTPLPSPTPTFPDTATPTTPPSSTPTPSATGTETPTETGTPSPSPTSTGTATPTDTDTPTPVPTATFSASPTSSPTWSPTFSPTETGTPSPSPTLPPTETETPSPTFSETPSVTPTETPTPTDTSTPTGTATATPSSTPTSTSTQTPSPTPTSSPTPTVTPTRPICKTGLYLLDILGGRSPIGNPVSVTGSLFFGDDLARDMESTHPAGFDTDPRGGLDLVVLDAFGAAHYVHYPVIIPQDFYFPPDPSFPKGRTVDIEVTADGLGVWILIDNGSIYRAGSTKDPSEPSELPALDLPDFLGADIPFPPEIRDPNLPYPGGATLRAVGFAVLDTDRDNRAEGYLVLDSQGGLYRLNPDGSLVAAGTYASLPSNHPWRLLDPEVYATPFFPGLDIARDIELHPSSQGFIVLDGWGGIHPVPVDEPENPVYFATRPEGDEGPGLPYITYGFDDPSTEADESDSTVFGTDAESIFIDLVFCSDGLGFYTLDRFGGIFALGSTQPSADQVVPDFTNAPYFFPNLFAVDLEAVEPAGETTKEGENR